jgi:hypothetical protein
MVIRIFLCYESYRQNPTEFFPYWYILRRNLKQTQTQILEAKAGPKFLKKKGIRNWTRFWVPTSAYTSYWTNDSILMFWARFAPSLWTRMVQFECEKLTFFSQSSCKISHNSHTQFLEFFTHFSQNFSSNYVVSVIYLKNTWA